MLDRRALLMSAAIAAPALLPGKVRADQLGCSPESIEANAALLDRYVAAVNAGDIAALQALFAKPYAQHGGLKGSREAFPDWRVTVEDRILASDKIVARNTWSGTHKQITIRTIDIWRVQGGQLAEHWDVIDIGALEKQLRES